jgi:Cu/Ag efflux protein CusF
MKYVRLGCFAGMVISLFLSYGYAGQNKNAAGKKEYTFRGKVEKIDVNSKTMTVNGQKVEGWMGAMTMSYMPDKADVLKNLKVGDEITAKVYEGDFRTLYDVKVVPPNGDTKGAPGKK